MDRRVFFKSLAVMAGTMVLDPEELLWIPTKTIFIPDTVRVLTWDEIDSLTLKQIFAKYAEIIFKPSPLFQYLRYKETNFQWKSNVINAEPKPWWWRETEAMNEPIIYV